jgi:hypothetical protein
MLRYLKQEFEVPAQPHDSLQPFFTRWNEIQSSLWFPGGRVNALGEVLSEKRISTPVFHYTTIKTLEKILQSRMIRFSQISTLNDKEELIHGHHLLREQIKIIRSIYTGYLGEIVDLAIARYDEYVSSEREIFVFCCSMLPDDLSQWRGYADDGGGVALAIDVTSVFSKYGRELDVKYAEMIYDGEKKIQLIQDVTNKYLSLVTANKIYIKTDEEINSISINLGYNWFHSLLRFKHSAFKSEKEFRFFITQNEYNLSKLRDVVNYDIDGARVSYCIYIPFETDDIGVQPIARIHLGPSRSHEAQQFGVRSMLMKHGFGTNVPVLRSSIPYRTW